MENGKLKMGNGEMNSRTKNKEQIIINCTLSIINCKLNFVISYLCEGG